MAKKDITSHAEVAECDVCETLPLLTGEHIQGCIRVIRGEQVILDRDLAQLYQVETSQLNRQVKRNIQRFPGDFMFQLTKEEADSLKCQNGTSSWGGDRRALPHAFTCVAIEIITVDDIDVNAKYCYKTQCRYT